MHLPPLFFLALAVVQPSGMRCGPENNEETCLENECCSAAGYCGIGVEYCAVPNECLPKYGRCDSDDVPPGKSTASDCRPHLGEISYKDDILHCTKQDVIALTYDDGPSENTGKLLDLLKQRKAKATFFISGNNNGKGEVDKEETGHPRLLKRMIDEGHQIGSHTFSHWRLQDLSQQGRQDDMYKNERAIANVIGKYPTYMRPPYGACKNDCANDMAELGYHRIQEDLDSMDWKYPDFGDLSKLIKHIDDAFDGQMRNVLVSQHDPLPSVFELTKYILDRAEKARLRPVTVGECLEDDEENWYR